MPRLPTRDDLGGVPSLRPSGGVARVDTTGIGRGIAQAGRLLQDASASLAAQWEADEAADVEARFQEFAFQEEKRLDEARRMLDPSQARGFADRSYGEGNSAYRARASSFLQAVPDRLKRQYDGRLFDVERTAYFAAQETERELQKASALRRLDSSLNGTFIPAMDRIATLPPLEAAREAERKLAEFEAMIDAVPGRDLPPVEKEARKALARQGMQLALANGLSPEQKALFDPSAAQETYASRVSLLESGGDPTAANPASSARGLGQFTKGTWLELVREHRPDVAAGRTNEQILALRDDPALSSEMIEVYGRVNGDFLRRQGFDATPGNMYLAHFAGPGGATALLAATPDTPVEDLLSADAIRDNPRVLKGKTAGEVVAWAAEQMGDSTVMVDWGSRLTALTPDQRMSIASDGVTELAAQRSARASADKAAYDESMESFRAAIHKGEAGYTEWQAMLDAGVFRGADATTYYNLIKSAQEDELNLAAAGDWLSGLMADGARPDTFDSDNKDRVSLLFDKGGLGGEALLSSDQEEAGEAATLLTRLTRTTGIMPESAVTALRTGIRSADPDTMLRSYGLVNRLFSDQATRASVEQFFPDMDMLRDYRAAAMVYPPDQLFEKLRLPTPESERLRQQRVAEAKREADEWSIDDVMGWFDPGFIARLAPGRDAPLPPFDANERALLMMDARDTYARLKAWGIDPDTAKEEAFGVVSQRWGATSAGSDPRLMRYPPEHHYPSVEGSHDWIGDQLDAYMRERVPEMFDTPKASIFYTPPEYHLVVTPETEAAVAAGMPPRYQVMYRLDGKLEVLSEEDSALPLTFSFNADAARDVERARFAGERARRDASPMPAEEELIRQSTTPVPSEVTDAIANPDPPGWAFP